MIELPDFIHAGYSKAASTWLQNLLRSREDIFFVYKTGFFLTLDSPEYEKGIEHYSRFFRGSSGYKVVIESQEHILLPGVHPELKCSTTNLNSVKSVLERIRKSLPGIRIIVIVRNQTDMLISRYLQYVLQGGSMRASEFMGRLALENNNYLEYADYRYSQVISIMHELFGEKNTLVLFHEELKHDPGKFIETLSSFLNCDLSGVDAGRKKNIGASPMGIELIRKLNTILVAEKETYESRTATRCPWFLWKATAYGIKTIDNIFSGNKSKTLLLSEREKKQIREIYKADNCRLANMFDKPLKNFGYYY